MMAKLLIDGKEFDIEILDPKLQELLAPPKKKTGYERVGKGEVYYFSIEDGSSEYETDDLISADDEIYDNANYYSDKTVAENNARADKLMRQLRRFAVEHRKTLLNRADSNTIKFVIKYDGYNKMFLNDLWTSIPPCGAIYFDSKETCQLAVNTFYDELIWYFTEYKDSL